MTGELLRADEVAEFLGMTRDWVYAESRAGRIPHVKLGRYYRYRRRSIERWMHAIESDRSVPGAGNGQRARASSARRRGE